MREDNQFALTGSILISAVRETANDRRLIVAAIRSPCVFPSERSSLILFLFDFCLPLAL